MLNANIKINNLVASKELAVFNWVRPDGKKVDLAEMELLDKLKKPNYYKFWVHFDCKTKQFLNIYINEEHDNGESKALDEDVLTSSQKEIIVNWAKNFLIMMKIEEMMSDMLQRNVACDYLIKSSTKSKTYKNMLSLDAYMKSVEMSNGLQEDIECFMCPLGKPACMPVFQIKNGIITLSGQEVK